MMFHSLSCTFRVLCFSAIILFDFVGMDSLCLDFFFLHVSFFLPTRLVALEKQRNRSGT